jgi:hypothetical protein
MAAWKLRPKATKPSAKLPIAAPITLGRRRMARSSIGSSEAPR